MTSDQSRARALALALVGPEGLSEDTVAGIEMVLAAVRLDERKAIAIWLVERHGLYGVARAIERGAHVASGFVPDYAALDVDDETVDLRGGGGPFGRGDHGTAS